MLWLVAAVALFVAGLAFFLWFNRRAALEDAQRIATARAAYDAALEALGRAPGDVQRRRAALEAGRAYGALLRECEAGQLDEAGIANDIATAMGK